MKKEGLPGSEKERLQRQKTSLEKKIKEIEIEGKEYGNRDDTTKKWDIEEISELAGDFSEKIQELYEELFLFFKHYDGLISKNIGINRKKSLSALLSTAEKVGLLEVKENINYISGGLKFTKTIDSSDEELMAEINKNSDFKVDNQKSTLTLTIIDEDIWTFFDWNGDSRKDLSYWKEIVTGKKL